MSKAPILNNPSVVGSSGGTSPYSPIRIAPDSSQIVAVNSISKNLENISKTLGSLNDYREGTQLLKQVADLSGQAITEQWDPDQFTKQLDKTINGYQFNNPKMQAQMMRLVELHATDTTTKLAGMKAQFTAQKAIADTMSLADTLKGNTHNLSDYTKSYALFSDRINNAVKNKIINPEAGEKMLLAFKGTLSNEVIANQMSQNPQGLLSDLNAGKYNSIMDEQSKLKLISTVKRQLQQQQIQAYNLQRVQREETYFKYSQALGSKQIDVSDVMKADIPADIKHKLLASVNQQNKPDLHASFAFGNIEQNILHGRYSNLHTLQDDIAKNNLPLNYSTDLQQKYILLNAKQQAQSGNGSQTGTTSLDDVFKNPFVKNIESIYIGKIQKAVSLASQGNIATAGSPENKIIQKYDPQIYGNLFKLKFRAELAKCVQQSGIGCLKNIQSIADKAYSETITPYSKEKFYEANANYFNTMQVGNPPTNLGLFSISHSTIQPPPEFNRLIFGKVYQIFTSSQVNPSKTYDVRTLLSNPHLIEFKLNKETAKQLGVLSLKAKVQFTNGQLYLIPNNYKLWEKYFNGTGNK